MKRGQQARQLNAVDEPPLGDLLGFTAVRADRDTKASGKSKGGGLIMYINNRWCNPGHISVKTVSCWQDLELAVSLRPYYLLREFSHVITVCVYIPPRADAATACEKIHSVTARLQTKHPETFMIISGDFNHVTLDSPLAVFHQVIDCPTVQQDNWSPVCWCEGCIQSDSPPPTWEVWSQSGSPTAAVHPPVQK